MNFVYKFHPHGTSVKLAEPRESQIWVDNGNALADGILDHHQSPAYSCTVEIICAHPEYFTSIAPDENDTITIHTHFSPDTDALFSIYLVQYYLEHKAFPDCLKELLAYVKMVDEGRIHFDVKAHPHVLESIYAVFSFLFEQNRSEDQVDKAMRVIDYAIRKLQEKGDYTLAYSPILLAECEPELEAARVDYSHYLADLSEGRCYETECNLPLSNGEISPGKSKCLIWKAAPTCTFNRIWARDAGYLLTLVPYEIADYTYNHNSYPCSRAIISLNPDAVQADTVGSTDADASVEVLTYSLLPIARYLEGYEQEKESSLLGDAFSCKRDHSTCRGGNTSTHANGQAKPSAEAATPSVFEQSPFVETSDPWFITSDATLIDAPHSGSLLSLDEIINVMTSFGDCTLLHARTRVILPFSFELEKTQMVRNALDAAYTAASHPPTDLTSYSGLDLSKRYLNTMLQEFVKDPKSCRFYNGEKSQCLLFPYGVGLFFFEIRRDYTDRKAATYTTIHDINAGRFRMDEEMASQHPLLQEPCRLEGVHFERPHYYTSIQLTPENLKISNQPLEDYAKQLCTIDGQSSSLCRTMELSYRQAVAYSRIGCSIVSTTDASDPTYRHFENEWFFLYLLALEQRYTLMECKRELVTTKLNSRPLVKNLREMLITFTSSGYFTSAVEDEVGDSFYRTLTEDVFQIAPLKEEVENQLEQLDTYHENKLNATLDKISVWILPFMVLSTILQCSIITMEPLIGVSGHGFPFAFSSNAQAWISWGILILVILVAFVLLKLTSRRKK